MFLLGHVEYEASPLKNYTYLHVLLVILSAKPKPRGKQIWLDSDGVFSANTAFSRFILDPIYSKKSSHQWKILRDLCTKGKIYPSYRILNYSFLMNWPPITVQGKERSLFKTSHFFRS